MAYFHVRESFVVNLDGANVLYQQGEVVDERDAAYRKSPHLFVPLIVRGVEQATAAPGEKRAARFGRKPAKADKPATAADEKAIAATIEAEAEAEPEAGVEAETEPEPAGKPLTIGDMKGRP